MDQGRVVQAPQRLVFRATKKTQTQLIINVFWKIDNMDQHLISSQEIKNKGVFKIWPKVTCQKTSRTAPQGVHVWCSEWWPWPHLKMSAESLLLCDLQHGQIMHWIFEKCILKLDWMLFGKKCSDSSDKCLRWRTCRSSLYGPTFVVVPFQEFQQVHLQPHRGASWLCFLLSPVVAPGNSNAMQRCFLKMKVSSIRTICCLELKMKSFFSSEVYHKLQPWFLYHFSIFLGLALTKSLVWTSQRFTHRRQLFVRWRFFRPRDVSSESLEFRRFKTLASMQPCRWQLREFSQKKTGQILKMLDKKQDVLLPCCQNCDC